MLVQEGLSTPRTNTVSTEGEERCRVDLAG
jgi:hypothetical protein